MPLGIGSALWAVVLPRESTNLIVNPSFERGTATLGTIESCGIGTTSAFQQFGAWSLFATPSSNGTSGAVLGTYTEAAGVDYSFSAYVRGVSGVPYILAAANTLDEKLGSVAFTGDGAWQYVAGSYTGLSATSRHLIVRKNSGNNTGTFYVDGVQIEVGSATTYIDGDQPGCEWLGAPHASTSQRSGQYRGGGSVVALADIGLSVDQMPGVGVPPIEVSTQSYAVVDGTEFQRQRAAARQFTLTAKPLVGASLGDFHVTRRTLWDAFKPDAVTPQQPVRFLYVGGQGTQQIDAYYDNGMELGNMDGPIAEDTAIGFVATDPYWYSPTQQGTSLAPRVNLGSVKYIANRDRYGRWGTMGPSGSALDNVPNAIVTGANGLVYVGGAFGSAAGTRVRFMAVWNPTTGAWGSLVGGTLNGEVREVLQYPDGNLYAAGLFGAAAGTTANGIARYNVTAAQWGTLNGGGMSVGAQVYALTLGLNGLLYMGGVFTTAAGTAAGSVAQYNPFSDRFGTMTTTGITGNAIIPVNDMVTGLDGKIYTGGNFTTAGGTTANNIAFWNPDTGAWGTMGLGVQVGGLGGNPRVDRLAVAPDARLYIGGRFGSAGGGSITNFAIWNGVAYSKVGGGSVDSSVSMLFAGSSGDISLGGNFTVVGGVSVPSHAAVFNGASYLPFDISLANSVDIQCFTQAPDGTSYMGLVTVSGTATVASVAQVVNTGRAIAYPTLRVRAPTSGTGQLYQFVNTLTNDGIYFRNLVLQPGEQATLTLQPGNRSFTSSFRGNIFGNILPGSNLTSWALHPGTNYVSFFSDTDSLSVDLFYTPRGWSIDSGTIA